MKRVIGVMSLLLMGMGVYACGQQDTVSSELTQREQGSLSSANDKPKNDDFDLFLDSTIELDVAAGTITLPLFRGTHDGDDVFYIITESSDEDDAEARGVNESPKLANAIGTAAVQAVNIMDGVVEFKGTVDFTPERVVVPNSETGFPPDQAEPGSRGLAEPSFAP